MSAGLVVPDSAMQTVWSLLRNTEGLDTHNAVAAAQMIAAPIVAAEMRAFATSIEASGNVTEGAFTFACRAAAADLRQRADELDAT